MLQSLHVKNLALIDEIEVELTDGLNILSGETGAGKSIIIGSINLALGEKVPKEMLRDNGENAFVELIFHITNEKTKQALIDLEVELDDDTVILSRKITNGRAVARVNGEAVSASQLKKIASLLIDIHGQQEHQSLIQTKKHLEILDEYAEADLADTKTLLAETYREYRILKQKFEDANVGEDERKREIALLEFEINEIEESALRIGEDEELEQEHRRHANGKKILQAVSLVHGCLSEEDGSASEQIGRSLRELGSVSMYDETLGQLENQLVDIENLLADFNHDLTSYLSESDFDEETFYHIEKRLDLVNHLKSKYGQSIETILESLEDKKERFEQLTHHDEYLNQVLNSLKRLENKLSELCEEVSRVRRAKSETLVCELKKALQDLNFLDVQLEMSFTKLQDFTVNGTDSVEFMISTNPGESLKSLSKVASGGEMSRIMLAMKSVLADQDEMESLIFDEIDSGISGRTAQMVSEKMNVLGRNHQLICITHLPQIAAMADAHYLIEKSVEDNTTVSRIHRLSEAESINELARMLGGVEITETVLQNAKEMKELAHMKK